jgi:hypothetical protein
LVTGYKYVIEDSDGDECARVAYSALGFPKACVTGTSRYRIRGRRYGVKVATTTAVDSSGVAVATWGKGGTITTSDQEFRTRLSAPSEISQHGPAFNRAAALVTRMSIVDADNHHVMTLSWQDARIVWRPYALGTATLGDADVSNELLPLIACLAFNGFAAACSVGGGA